MGRRSLRTAAALSLTVAFAGTSGLLPARGSTPCPGVASDGSWKTIATPLPAEAFTVDAAGRLYVAGEDAVVTSRDGGCSWSESLRLDGPSVHALVDERVTALATAGSSVVAATTGPHALVSDDAGATWTRTSAGLDLPGEPIGLYPAPSGGAVYMLVRQEVRDGPVTFGFSEQGVSAFATVVYRSSDGGRTWARGDSVGTSYTGPNGLSLEGGRPPGAAWDLAVDPADPDHLLAAASDGIFESADGGRTWSAAFLAPGSELRAVAWAGSTAIAVDPSTGTLYESAGGPWQEYVYPQLRTEQMTAFPHAAAWAWAAGADGDVVLSGPKGIFRRTGASLVDVTPSALGGPGETAADLVPAGSRLWGRLLDGSALLTEVSVDSSRSVAQTTTTEPPSLPPAQRAAGDVPSARVREAPVELVARARRVSLAPGEERTVSYEATLGPRPVSVDLFFLVDTTSSMGDTIRALVGGMDDIAARLARSGIRLRAGVGSFRTYPRETDRVDVDYAYRRDRALGPVDAGLLRALYALEGGGSSGANLTAVLQAVTGAGQDVFPPGPSKADVPGGRDAGFSDGALKVVMHFADTWFGTPERGDPSGYYAPGTWPGPTFDAAGAALRDADVLHLGVARQPGAGGTVLADADVVEDMRALSRATSSLAGGRGADCDGDGRTDLAPGDPLVCLLERGAESGGMAAVVTGLVEALEKRGDVSLVEESESPLVRAITPAAHSNVDLRASQRLRFDVTVACGLADADARESVRLGLLVAGERAAGSTLQIACAELPATVSRPSPTQRRVTPLALVPPIPAPPPPHPVPGPGSVTAPAPVQAPAPAQAPGGHPQAVSVEQRQQQPQASFAVAVQRVREQTQMQHALVRTRSRNPLATARLWTGVGALSILWVWGMATAVVTSARRARV